MALLYVLLYEIRNFMETSYLYDTMELLKNKDLT